MSHAKTKATNRSATNRWRIHDAERPVAVIDSTETLEKMIRDLPGSGPTPNRIVELESPEGDKLSLGIAGPNDADNANVSDALAFVQFTNATLDPPYLVPIGDASLSYEHGGVLVFRFDGSWTEVLRRNCVPIESLIRIAQHFYRTQTLPDWIGWEEV